MAKVNTVNRYARRRRQKLMVRSFTLGLVFLGGFGGARLSPLLRDQGDDLEPQEVATPDPGPGCDPEGASPIEKIPFPGRGASAQELMDYQEQVRETVLESLHEIARSPRALELVAFLESKASFSIPLGPVVTQKVLVDESEMDDQSRFEVVFMPEVYASMLPSSVVWQAGENVLRIAATFTHRGWLAIIVLHELEHVWRTKRGLELPAPRESDRWADDEVIPHSLECENIRFWREQAYNRLAEIGAIILDNPRDAETTVTGIFPEIRELSDHEAGLAIGSLYACAAFEEADRRDTSRRDAYRFVTATY